MADKAYPIPLMGPINGDINMAPIITAGELLIKPMEATNIEQIRIQIFIEENSISLLISSTVFSLSTPS